ncbi:hypothetical protein [Nocardia colli]|uniref:hypothetical protein n=1 Tax=Nocardia colli TaxID=2545717 RepID=UPI0035E380C3
MSEFGIKVTVVSAAVLALGIAMDGGVSNAKPTDYSTLSCPQLALLAEKYDSIANSAGYGDSPAAQARALQAIQAANKAAEIHLIMSKKC